MSKLIEFLLGSLLIAISTVAFIFFSTLHYILRVGSAADCIWRGSAKAWIDANHDGLLSQGEAPLGNVMIHVDDIEKNLRDIGWPTLTDPKGEVQLSVRLLDCSSSALEIYADAPEGFHVATRPRLEIGQDLWGTRGTGLTYYFGFVAEK